MELNEDEGVVYKFTLSIGYAVGNRQEFFTAEELGITEDMSEEEIESVLDEEWRDWSNNYVDGHYVKV